MSYDSIALITYGIAKKKSLGVTQISVWSDWICFATIRAYFRSGDPSNPIEKVCRAGLPNLLS